MTPKLRKWQFELDDWPGMIWEMEAPSRHDAAREIANTMDEPPRVLVAKVTDEDGLTDYLKFTIGQMSVFCEKLEGAK